MQGTWFWSLVQEDPTCCGADKPVCTATEPALSSSWAIYGVSLCAATPEARAPGACAPQQEKLLQGEGCTKQGKVAPAAAIRGAS